MPKILITGAGGYIGCILCHWLAEKNYTILAVDLFFFGKELLQPHDNIQLIEEDVRTLSEAHFQDLDCVIDLVGISNDQSAERFSKITWQINKDSRIRTAKLAKKYGIKKYILVSSCSVYGFKKRGLIVNETSDVNPLSIYAKANVSAEQKILSFANDEFCVTVVRLATVYGYSPRMRFDLVVNEMIYNAYEHSLVYIGGNGTQWRPLVHVKDVANALLFLLTKEPQLINGEIFNIGSIQNNFQMNELAEKIVKSMKKQITVEYRGDPDKRSYRVSFEKIAALGFQSYFTIEDAINEIYEKLEKKLLTKIEQSITLEWYQSLDSEGKFLST